MTEPNPRRVLPVVAASLGVLVIAYLLLKQSSIPVLHGDESTQGLHRSNAVRRSPRHRRWRRGYVRQDLSYDPIQRALDELREDRDFGVYYNVWTARNDTQIADVDLGLRFSNISTLYEALARRRPDYTEAQRQALRDHVYLNFVWCGLRSAYPEGYVIGPDLAVLQSHFGTWGIPPDIVADVIEKIDAGYKNFGDAWNNDLDSTANPPAPRPPSVAETDELTRQEVFRALGEDVDQEGDDSDGGNNDTEEDAGGSQNMLDLLYHIAGESARRDGYIHRGVECNSCGACPIQGIRYHCANCYDYDLCELCEAGQVHVRNHVFYKIRIPAPSRGHIKQVAPKWYPGNPNAFPMVLPGHVSKVLLEDTGMDRTEVDAHYEQFKCLAGCDYPHDPLALGMAIDRRGFDQYFTPNSKKPGPPNLIYDRIFAFYDSNGDGLIGFEEFLKGLANLQKKTRMDRLKRIFAGYDLDGDGYVDRRDFLRMFRSYYALSKELNREMVNSQEEFGYIDEEIREVVQGSQPISAAFGGNILFGHESRSGEDKRPAANGDLVISGGPSGVLQNDFEPRGDRNRAVGNAAIGHRPRSHPFRTFRDEPPTDEPLMHLPIPNNFELLGIQHADDATEAELTGPNPPLQAYGWPPLLTPEPSDIIQALGVEMPLEEITDPVDRSRVFYAQSQRLDEDSDRHLEMSRTQAISERWHRRQFYLDQEEGMLKPQGYTEPDSSDDENEHSVTIDPKIDIPNTSRRQSLRSRSSSKVRFEDSAIDTDYETRSNASSRSVTLNERWGGHELSQPEADVGKEILYQAVQQGFNELLDVIFKKKEDEAMEAQSTKKEREKWHGAVKQFEARMEKAREDKEEALRKADLLRTEELIGESSTAGNEKTQTSSSRSPMRERRAASPSPLPRPRIRTRSPDENSDHIEIMFGGIVRREVEKALSIVGFGRSPQPEEPLNEDSDRDPTLPQFRPNEVGTTKDDVPEIIEPPSEETLTTWVQHQRIDREAEDRGGYGKLNFNELAHKMVREDDSGKPSGKNGEDDEEPTGAFWESSADLGKMAFVGTWLEMASF